MSEEIIKSAYLDYKVSIRLAGVIDLIAGEAKYQLTCFSSFQKLWMMSRTSGKRRYTEAVYNKLPQTSATCLLSFNALTGSDTTSYFANHTNKTCWKTFIENHQLLCDLGIGELSQETIVSAEKFVCRLHNVRTTDTVDSVRHILFSPTNNHNIFHQQALHFIFINCMSTIRA